MKSFVLPEKGKKELEDNKENSAKCIKSPKGKAHPAKPSAQPSVSCLCSLRNLYSLGRITHFISVLSRGLLALVLCSSYFKSWLRSQVSLGGLFPKNTPASQVILYPEHAKQEDALALPSGRL